jgi:Ni,Fe-hydrogenase III small subunit
MTPSWSGSALSFAGACACDGGEFGVSYASCGAVANVIPVDVKIPGCPPTPIDLLTGLLGALRG